MSGKQMKKLRRQAEKQTVGVPWAFGDLRHNFNRDGRSTGVKVQLHARSGRAIYQQLKKE